MQWKVIRAPIAVGVVVVVGLIGLMYMVSVVKTSIGTQEGSYTVYAVFEDVTGLVVRSNVNMVGIPIGVVESLERMESQQGVRALVGIRVNPDVVLYAGEANQKGDLVGSATVIRKQSSILGDYFLSLTPGALGPVLAPGDFIPIVVGTSGIEAVLEQAGKLSELYPKLDRIATNVEELTKGLAKSLGGEKGGQNLEAIVTNLREATGDLKMVAVAVKAVSEEAQAISDEGTFRAIAFNLASTTEDARGIAQRIGQIVEAGDVDALVKNLGRTSEQLAEIGVDLKDLLRDGIQPRIKQLDKIFRNVERFSLELARFSEKNAPPLTETVESVREFSKKLVALVDRSQGDVEAALGSVRTTLEVARNSLVGLNETIENVRSISGDLRAGRGTVGRLLTDDRLIKEVEEIVTETKGFVKSYTLMQTEVELASSRFLRGKSFKNVFSIRFRPKEDKYYLLQIVDDPRGYTTDKFIVTESNDADKPPVLKERIETTSHTLKLSFQFAKSFYFMTGRFGIMENTGGLGLDFNFFQDRLNFQFDLFDFTMNTYPRLRSIVEWEIIKHLFLAGGADDLLNDTYRDYFFSIGIRFTDDDLKSLLMAAPSISP